MHDTGLNSFLNCTLLDLHYSFTWYRKHFSIVATTEDLISKKKFILSDSN